MPRFQTNPVRVKSPTWADAHCRPFLDPEIIELHRSIPEYERTPLITLPGLAAKLGLRNILVKDESKRFRLRAFKALGASYAIYRWVCSRAEQLELVAPAAKDFFAELGGLKEGRVTFCTATDGNHGRGVAWVARKLGQRAVIYMPEGSTLAIVQTIKHEGAEVIVIEGNYDAAVEQAALAAEQNGWEIISDTSWPGYEEIPRWISAGYMTLFYEIKTALSEGQSPDFIFVPAGVGALAATAAFYYSNSSVKLISVEPDGSACCLKSIASADHTPQSISSLPATIMAGLHCGTPSPIAWPFMCDRFDLFMSISDQSARAAGDFYHSPIKGDPVVESGPTGSASLGGLLALVESENRSVARGLGLTKASTVLVINTEGVVSPE